MEGAGAGPSASDLQPHPQLTPRAVPPSEALSDSGLLKDEISKVETNEEAALSPGANQRLEVRGKGKNRNEPNDLAKAAELLFKGRVWDPPPPPPGRDG